jgi:hypothetical protein
VIFLEHLLLQIGYFRELFTHKHRHPTTAKWSKRGRRLCPVGENRRQRGRLQAEMKILYKPFAIIAGVIAARLGRQAFKTVWAKIDSADPPDPTTADATLPKVVGAAALEAATMAGIAAAVDRGTARVFHYLTGIWPGKNQDDEKEED